MINNQILVEAVKSIPIVADRDKWILTLDKEEGALFYAPREIPDSTLHQVTDEYAVYLDKDQKPTGVVVEYYKENFLQHHKTFTDVTSVLFGDLNGESDEKIIEIDPQKNKANVNIFTALLESTLIKEAGTKLVTS